MSITSIQVNELRSALRHGREVDPALVAEAVERLAEILVRADGRPTLFAMQAGEPEIIPVPGGEPILLRLKDGDYRYTVWKGETQFIGGTRDAAVRSIKKYVVPEEVRRIAAGQTRDEWYGAIAKKAKEAHERREVEWKEQDKAHRNRMARERRILKKEGRW
ncbi:hypothetical protein UFOVP1382_90 [uncultured Caudovirales phage]|uniref:Uncharacterized protein n=1 Tax=uncultured Caudovirales phage TaxID=2100421 RepID=A0A6J5RXW7_9CAUD|nr:hypothetical protein UFOVP1382_90 [uncultured Caudovirales phage]